MIVPTLKRLVEQEADRCSHLVVFTSSWEWRVTSVCNEEEASLAG